MSFIVFLCYVLNLYMFLNLEICYMQEITHCMYIFVIVYPDHLFAFVILLWVPVAVTDPIRLFFISPMTPTPLAITFDSMWWLAVWLLLLLIPPTTLAAPPPLFTELKVFLLLPVILITFLVDCWVEEGWLVCYVARLLS